MWRGKQGIVLMHLPHNNTAPGGFLAVATVEKLVTTVNAPLYHLQLAGVQCKWAAFHIGQAGTLWLPFSLYYPAVGAATTPSSMAVLTFRCEFMSWFSEYWGFSACSDSGLPSRAPPALIGRSAVYANCSGRNWAGCGRTEHHVSEGEIDWKIGWFSLCGHSVRVVALQL